MVPPVGPDANVIGSEYDVQFEAPKLLTALTVTPYVELNWRFELRTVSL